LNKRKELELAAETAEAEEKGKEEEESDEQIIKSDKK
jgi:hypothetical protein